MSGTDKLWLDVDDNCNVCLFYGDVLWMAIMCTISVIVRICDVSTWFFVLWVPVRIDTASNV